MSAKTNPFRVSRIEALVYRFSDDDWDALLRRLDRSGGRGSIVGPNGSGKTTLMLELAQRLSSRGLDVRQFQLTRLEPRLPPGLLRDLGPSHALLMDSAGCLSPVQWLKLRWKARHAGVFVVTAHCEGSLPTLCRCRTDVRLLDELVRELTGTPADALGVDAQTLWTRHEGNVREALRELYDRWAALRAERQPC